MPVCKEPFGAARDGRPVDKYILRRGALEAEVLTYGAALPDDLAQSMAAILEAAGGGSAEPL